MFHILYLWNSFRKQMLCTWKLLFLFQQLFLSPSYETYCFYTKFLKSSEMCLHLEMYLLCSNNFYSLCQTPLRKKQDKKDMMSLWEGTFHLYYWRVWYLEDKVYLTLMENHLKYIFIKKVLRLRTCLPNFVTNSLNSYSRCPYGNILCVM